VGKTRLALQVARTVQRDFPDGVVVVELASLADPDLVPAAIGAALGLREKASTPDEARLVAYLQTKRLLLVLDNLEHLLAAAPFLGRLLAACTVLQALVTSRAPLRVQGEQEFAVGPLRVPIAGTSALDRLAQTPAVELFVQRARAVRPEFSLNARNAPAVAEICRRLDGLPLAIELAAARVRLYPPQALLDRLQGPTASLAVSVGGSRDAPSRQRTLRDTITWSYALLGPDQQAFFRRLAVFAGGFTLAAADWVTDTSPSPGSQRSMSRQVTFDAEEQLAFLVEQSLVRVEQTPDGEPRFGLLETIRAFAWEALEAHGEAAATRQEHAAYFAAVAREIENGLDRGDPLRWVDHELDNFRTALDWYLQHNPVNGILLATRWGGHRKWRGYYAESGRWVENLLARAPERTPERAIGLVALADNDRWFRTEQAVKRGTEALEIAREVGARRVQVSAATVLASSILDSQGNRDLARSLLDEAVEVARTLVDPTCLSGALRHRFRMAVVDQNFALAERLLDEALELLGAAGGRHYGDIINHLGQLARARCDHRRAVDLLEQSVAIFRRAGNEGKAAWSLTCLADPLLSLGKFERARAVVVEALNFFRDHDTGFVTATALWCAGRWAVLTNRTKRGVRLIAKANLGLEPDQRIFTAADRLALYYSVAAAARITLGEEAYRQAWTKGVAMSDAEAIAYALADDEVEEGDRAPSAITSGDRQSD
jgi:predicted ATPase